MIKRILEYLQDRKIKRTLRKATSDIASAVLPFAAIETKYVKGRQDQQKLLSYSILLVSGNPRAMRPAERFNSVLREYLHSLELAIELKSLKQAILIQKECAKEQFERGKALSI